MFKTNLKLGAVKRLHNLLKEPLLFDALEFTQFNSEQLARGPSSLNDLFLIGEVFEAAKKSLYPNLSKLTHHLSNNVGLVGEDEVKLKEFPLRLDIVSNLIDSEPSDTVLLMDITNQQLERIYESFDIKSGLAGFNFLNDDVKRTLEFFLLSEYLYLVFYGLAKVERIQDKFVFSVNESQFNEFYKPKWFANFLENCSSVSNFAYTDMLPDGISLHKAADFIKLMSKNILDKVFSIHWDYLTRKLANTEGYQFIRVICDIFALIFFAQIKMDKDSIDLEEVTVLGITEDEIKQLRVVNESLGVMDRIFKFSGNRIYLCNPCVSMHSRKLMEVFTRISRKNKFDNEVGEFFEKKYIAEFISQSVNDGSERYKIHGDLRSEDIDPKLTEGDIDLIVEDTTANRFIFMQIKYIRKAGRPFLRGDVEYLTNSKIQYGISQLDKISDLHKKGLLNDVLKDKGISQCSRKNTIYMLVSNITNLDFQKHFQKDIVFYEWNTLRNLLMDGRCEYAISGKPETRGEWRHHSPLPLGEPSQTIDILMDNSPIYRQIDAHKIFRSRYLKTSFKIDGNRCEAIGLGI